MRLGLGFQTEEYGINPLCFVIPGQLSVRALEFAKRMGCVRLAGAFENGRLLAKSGSKLAALQALREVERGRGEAARFEIRTIATDKIVR